MRNVFLLLFLLTSPVLLAQSVKLLSGSLKTLKGQKSYNITFRYDSMQVGMADPKPEKVFLMEVKNRWEEREPGRGSDFIQEWFEDRKLLYEPSFIQNFKEYAKVELPDAQAPYTLIVKTKHTEGGWFGGVLAHPGEIDGEVWVVESVDPTKVVARIGFYKITGKIQYPGDFEMTTRIQSAYAIAGKGLGDYFKRKSK
ncbi:hypothetical protein [Chryseolinea soli]|uniref:Uncharacterized protein n=1 Tax=Chryseolinea soli TaxID=2321403 RepID=A0A385SS91_9BACT|nr:hypothetical protein [Chryseolinea soli]AYB33752.1 hypothetical protein D4L85_25625 [Chryseolinea soli]